MAKKTGSGRPARQPNATLDRIKELRRIGREGRSETDNQELQTLVAEHRRVSFCKLAPRRVNNLLTAVKRLRACSNRASYDFSDAEAGAMMAVIESAIDGLKTAYAPQEQSDAPPSFIDHSWRR